MSVKIFDTMTTATPNFPLAYAEKINVKLQDGTEDNLQNLFDNDGLIGGGGDSSITLTQEEYEALPEEQKLDGLYYTYDTKRIYKNGVQYGASDAEGIGYNNAESGIQATTVQGAIDKVVKTVEDTYAKTTDIPTTLPANGGNADTVNNHTVKSDVPENAVFTDTVLEVNDADVSKTTVWSSKKTSDEIAEKVGKTDIATTIDGKSTDTQVPSAKAVWNKSKNKIQQLLDGTDIIVYADSISNEIVTDTVRIMNATNSPYGVDNVNNDFHYTIYNVNDDKYKRILAYDIRKNDMYMIMKNNNIWGTWAKLATMDKVESKYEEATLATPVDWNTLNTKARYYVSGGAIMTNAPMQQPFGELVVETAGDGSVCRVQKFFSFDGRLYMRRWTGSIWNEWYKFDGTAN